MKFYDSNFFNRPVLEVCEDLIGQYMVKDGKKLLITEIEAYDGPKDLACYASKGRTKRTEVLFGPPGRFYVYLCYGIHWLLNVVTGPEDYPAAILIRGAGEISGPGRLTKQLAINADYNTKPAAPQTGLYFMPTAASSTAAATAARPHHKVQKTPRIGVDYAGPVWSQKPYRFVLNHSHK